MTEPTWVHGPSENAPSVTEEYAVCRVCGHQWQVKSPTGADTKGCSFCGTDEDNIQIMSEKADYGGAHIVYPGISSKPPGR